MIFLLKESRGSRRPPADPRSESRLSIPQRGALQRSSSLLPQPSSILKRTVEIVENYSVNGKCLIVSAVSALGCIAYCINCTGAAWVDCEGCRIVEGYRTESRYR